MLLQIANVSQDALKTRNISQNFLMWNLSYFQNAIDIQGSELKEQRGSVVKVFDFGAIKCKGPQFNSQ